MEAMQKPHLPNWLKKLPNKLTYSRIAVIPILLMIYPWGIDFISVFSACLFGAAALTDFFDGYLARKYHNTTRMGEILDPIADKLLITAAIVLLANSQIMPAWMAGLFLCREVAVSGLRIIAAEKNQGLAVTQLAKWKTLFQDAALFVLLANINDFHALGMILAWIALGLSYYSGYLYWRTFWENENKYQPNAHQQDEVP